MYTQFFANKSTIKNMEQLLPGSAKHISCNALLLFIFASQALPLYSPTDPLSDSCCTILTDKFKEKFCKALQVNERSYKRNIKELVDAGLLRLINKKEQSYFVNPFLASKIGESDVLRYVRECFSADNIQSQSAEKYCKLFLTLDNVGKYSAFVYKNINYTELIVFLLLASEAGFCFTPNSPEECNKVSLNVKKMEKLASTLNIGVSTLSLTYILWHLPYLTFGSFLPLIRSGEIILKSKREVNSLERKFKNFFFGSNFPYITQFGI